MVPPFEYWKKKVQFSDVSGIWMSSIRIVTVNWWFVCSQQKGCKLVRIQFVVTRFISERKIYFIIETRYLSLLQVYKDRVREIVAILASSKKDVKDFLDGLPKFKWKFNLFRQILRQQKIYFPTQRWVGRNEILIWNVFFCSDHTAIQFLEAMRYRLTLGPPPFLQYQL